MNNFLKNTAQNNTQEAASINYLNRPLAIAKIRQIETKLNEAFNKIEQLREDVKKIIELRKQTRNATGGKVMFTEEKQFEKALQNLKDISSKLATAFEELKALRQEMHGIYKDYGLAKSEKATKEIGMALGTASEEEEEDEVG